MRRGIPLLLLAMLTSACSTTTSNTPEPQDLADIKQQLDISEVWSRDFGSMNEHVSMRLQPAIDNNALFTIDTDGDVKAYRKDNGETIWESSLDLEITAGLGISDNHLYAVSTKGDLLALSRTDGSVVWKKELGSEVLAPPVSAEGHVLVQTIDGRLVSLSSSTGKQRWVYQRREPALSLRGTSTPMVFRDIVVSGFGGGLLVAVRLKDGRLIWERPVSIPSGRNQVQRLSDVDTSPMIAGVRLFAASYQGKLIALDMRTGRKSWSKNVSSYQSMSADNRNIYLTDEFGVVRAYDQSSGTNIWKQDKLRGRRVSAPVVAGSYVVVGDLDGYTHWLDSSNGSFVGRYRPASDPVVSQPLVQNNTIYVSTTGGNIVAMRWK